MGAVRSLNAASVALEENIDDRGLDGFALTRS
jgi:hypothetical protein